MGRDTLWSKDGSQGAGEGWNGIVPSIPPSPAGRLARPVTVGRTSHGLRSMAQKPFQPSPAPWLPLPGTMTHATLGKWSLHFLPLPAERAGMREGRGCLGEPSGGRLFILRSGQENRDPRQGCRGRSSGRMDAPSRPCPGTATKESGPLDKCRPQRGRPDSPAPPSCRPFCPFRPFPTSPTP